MDMSDRLKVLEASHVALMTDHELFVKEHEKFVEEQQEEWRQQQERWKVLDAARKEEIERGKELDKRIAALVSGIGEFIRQGRG